MNKIICEQDGRDFYAVEGGLIATYPDALLEDFWNLEAAQALRVRFLAEHPNCVMSEE